MAKNPVTGLEESPAANMNDSATKPVVPDQTISDTAKTYDMNIGGQKPVTPAAPTVISPDTKVPSSASSAMTGAITQQGAYNPTTGGYETVNKETGVNTGAYAPDEKQKAWEAAGLSGAYNPDAFYRDPATGKLEMKPQTGAMGLITEPTKSAAAPVATPAAPTVTPTVTSETDKGAQADSVIDTMFPKDKYTDEERAAIKQGLVSTDPKLWADMMANNAKGAYEKATQVLNAFRTDRDIKLGLSREQQLNDRRVADLTQQYDNAIQNQKQRMEADQNNMAVVQGTSGRLQSRNMMNAINQLLDNNLKTYNQLVGNKDRDLQRLAEDIKYAQTVASNEYNDKISDEMQEMLKSIQSLDSTGSLNTQNGLIQARSFVQKTIENNAQHQADYYNKLQYISSRFDQYHKEYQENKAVDQDVTTQMGDGYLYNKFGSRVTNDQGQALHVGDTSGTFVGLQDDGLGGKIAIFRGLDGQIRTQQATTAPKLTDNQISAAQNLIAKGGDPSDVAKMLGLNGQQMAEALKGVSAVPAYDAATAQKMQVVYKEVTDADGNTQKVPGYFDPSTKQFVYSDGSSATTAPTTSGQISSAQKIADFSVSKRGTENLQCGQLVNDYWKMVTGKSMGIGDSIGSKSNAIRQAGYSDTPVSGGIFVSNPLNNNIGHTGIVQSVNPDGSITVLEANAQGKAEGQPPILKTYSAARVADMMFSKAPAGGAEAVGGTTEKTGNASQYGLRDQSELSNATDYANGTLTLASLKTLYGKNQNAIKRIQDARDQILADTNVQAIKEEGIDIKKIDPSIRSSLLTSTPSAIKAVVDAATYKAGIDMATARSTTGLNRIAFESAARAIAKARGDNNWSVDQYKRISDNYAAYSDPTKGLGVKRAALNTAINHIGEEVQTFKDLGNTNYPWLNNVLNNVRSATGAGEPLAQKIVAQALGSETAKAYAGAQSSQAEREAWANDMQANMSPAQQDAFAKLTIKLLAGAARSIKAEGLKSVSVGGKPVRQLENVLDDNTRQIVQSIGLDPNSFESAAATTTKSAPATKGLDTKASQSIMNVLRKTK